MFEIVCESNSSKQSRQAHRSLFGAANAATTAAAAAAATTTTEPPNSKSDYTPAEFIHNELWHGRALADWLAVGQGS